jgi:CRP-like cAMP-binding protein
VHHFAALQLLDRLATEAGIVLPEKQRIAAAVEIVELRPGECAFREGEQQACIYAVRSGLLKQYYTSVDGSEWIKSFTAEGDAFACIEALLPGGKTSFASEAIEPAVVERVSYRLVQTLASEHREWQQAVGAAYAVLAQLKVRRERDLLMLSAEEIYRQFAREAPHLAERVPQKDLAGYIGVTPVGLNRIIKRCTPTDGRAGVRARTTP